VETAVLETTTEKVKFMDEAPLVPEIPHNGERHRRPRRKLIAPRRRFMERAATSAPGMLEAMPSVFPASVENASAPRALMWASQAFERQTCLLAVMAQA
jgi:hypothetical protein